MLLILSEWLKSSVVVVLLQNLLIQTLRNYGYTAHTITHAHNHKHTHNHLYLKFIQHPFDFIPDLFSLLGHRSIALFSTLPKQYIGWSGRLREKKMDENIWFRVGPDTRRITETIRQDAGYPTG